MNKFCLMLVACVIPLPVRAEMAPHAPHPHDQVLAYAVLGEVDGSGVSQGGLATWDIAAWAGNDEHRLYVRSEGEYRDRGFEQAELWGLYRRPISDFWDAAVGYRRVVEPRAHNQVVLGVSGMLPLFIETEAFLFVGDRGDVSARLEQHVELPITQSLIAEPHLEFNLAAQDSRRYHHSAGLVSTELGLQLRYEVIRKLAPYVDFNFERKAGAAADHARDEGESVGEFTVRGGMKFWF